MEKTIFFAITIAIIGMVLAGCGHNMVVYSDGIGLDASINPESYTLGINFRYGKILTVAMKEKAQLNLKAGMTQKSGTGAGNTASGTVTTGLDTELNFATGDQTTGYTVDLEKVKRKAKSTKTPNSLTNSAALSTKTPNSLTNSGEDSKNE